MFWNKRLSKSTDDAFELPYRFRRVRKSAAMRDMVRETHLRPEHLVLPIFVGEGIDEPVEIESLPGVYRTPEKQLGGVVRNAWDEGVRSVLLFGVPSKKDAEGSDTWDEKGLMARMVRAAKEAVPEMVVITDNCFCSYTEHGHCGVVVGDHVDNDLTLQNLQKQAVIAAEAGADMVAPSAMMDGQVAAMREALDMTGFTDVGILSYASKFASNLYGPFRAAADCGLKGDRKSYQIDPANRRQALLEALADEEEAADMLMVKPGIMYLDVLSELRQQTQLPLAVYQVSGEYAMIKAAAEKGILDEDAVMMESLISFRRAGADLIITYFAEKACALLNEGKE
tara:strand:- start:218426 stop:219445 length:1020 start_codon:yes stop_codon:yes gene_type:complete